MIITDAPRSLKAPHEVGCLTWLFLFSLLSRPDLQALVRTQRSPTLTARCLLLCHWRVRRKAVKIQMVSESTETALDITQEIMKMQRERDISIPGKSHVPLSIL